MSQKIKFVKDQYNRPKDSSGNLVNVLRPGMYSIQQLIQHPRENGWKGDVFPDADSPNSFPYWDTYLTGIKGMNCLVSIFGEVACCFNTNAENSEYRVMQQQWEYQMVPSDFDLTEKELELCVEDDIHTDTAILEKLRSCQKYLSINFNVNPHYAVTHGSQRLHAIVGLVHSPITHDAVFWDSKSQRYRLKPKASLDHLDKDKANNSVFNLSWISGGKNQVMTDWTIEHKVAILSQ
jgi:hypothetical protein